MINLGSEAIKNVYYSDLPEAEQCAEAKVSIKNVGALNDYLYTPYFTNIDFESEKVQGTLKEIGDYALYDMRTLNNLKSLPRFHD